MGKRRGRRTRSTDGGRLRNLEDAWPTFRHHPYTFEGEIEQLGHLARSVNRAKRTSGRRGTVARGWALWFWLLALLFLLPMTIFVADWFVGLF